MAIPRLHEGGFTEYAMVICWGLYSAFDNQNLDHKKVIPKDVGCYKISYNKAKNGIGWVKSVPYCKSGKPKQGTYHEKLLWQQTQ